MSTEIIKISGGPLTHKEISITRYACPQSIVDEGLATSRKSIEICIGADYRDCKYMRLTYNQAIILAESILRGLGVYTRES